MSTKRGCGGSAHHDARILSPRNALPHMLYIEKENHSKRYPFSFKLGWISCMSNRKQCEEEYSQTWRTQ
eukprot:4729772-Amphidinium_carterae.2